MQKSFQYIRESLTGYYPENEIISFCYLIIEKISGFNKYQVLINKNTIFSIDQHQKIERIVDQLKKNYPIQYILGSTIFFELNFTVNDSVLIPRPETEELVEWIIHDHKQTPRIDVLDIGTGSGCIAISIMKNLLEASVTAYDISHEALEVASKNAKKLNAQINFKEVDITSSNRIYQKWDIIVSNPPYVLEKERNEMQANVLDYEPHLALFVPDNDPLLFYRYIGLFATQHLNKGGYLYFEINRKCGLETKKLLSKMGFQDIILRKDISGNDRMIRAYWAG